MKKIIGLLALSIATLGFLQLGATRAVADTEIDGGAPGWTWSGMVEVDDPSFHGGTAHAGGDGTYAVYTFNGTGVDVYVMGGQVIAVNGRHHRLGSAQVLIDGQLKADEPTDRPHDTFGLHLFTETGLEAGNHVLQIEPDGGWVVVDYITVQGGSDPIERTSGSGSGSGSGGSTAPSDKKPAAPSSRSSPGIPVGRTVSLMSMANNQYVTSQDGTHQLTASAKSVGQWEQFDVVDEGHGYVALKQQSGRYVCAEPSYADAPLAADRSTLDTSATSCEIFRWSATDDGTVSLQALNGLYITTDLMNVNPRAGLWAKAGSASKWEGFKVSVVNGSY